MIEDKIQGLKMGYLEECQTQINLRDFKKFLELWEEYCTSETIDVEECRQLLESVKKSEFAKQFGKYVESALLMWSNIPDENGVYIIGRLIIDLQSTNSPALRELAMELLKKKYSQDPHFVERLRLVGLRGADSFQGAISNYDLLAHMAVGKYVIHTAGWGVGEIVELSALREQVTIEFEHISGRKHLNFANAFKTLAPIDDDHFLARRFGDSEKLEEEAKKDPVRIVKLLLRDIGPLTAVEIKDAVCGLIIPEPEWGKWWQVARTKLKKDTMVEVPETLRDRFSLRKEELLHEERLLEAIKHQTDVNDIILTSFNFVRDFPSVLKDAELKKALQDKLIGVLEEEGLSTAQELQIRILLEQQLDVKLTDKKIEEFLKSPAPIQEIIDSISLAAFKRRILTIVKTLRSDWPEVFLSILFSNQQSYVREYLFKELNQKETALLLLDKLKWLQQHPQENPEAFNWYFQLLISKEGGSLPLGSKRELCHWLESFLILFQFLEFKLEWRELSKKMYALILGKRYAMVRQLIEGTSLEFINEFLLLTSKCQTLTDTDLKILRSLAAVVHPSLEKPKSSRAIAHLDGNILWTTESGHQKVQERIREIGTTEIVSNAKEIEAARALGDLRENSEYKFALEKRSRLQGELKTLSEQLHRSRIITPLDIEAGVVGIGSIVDVADSKGGTVTYTILGSWDADPENNVLSFQSKFVQSMLGVKNGDTFNFRDEEYRIVGLKTIFDVNGTLSSEKE